MENESTESFSMDNALLSPFLTFDSKPVPTGLCPLSPALLPLSSVLPLDDTCHYSSSQLVTTSLIPDRMLSPAITPVLGPMTPGDLLRFSSNEPSSYNLKSKFYSLFPNYKKSSFVIGVNQEYVDHGKLSHREAEQRRRDEFKEKLLNLKGVLGIKKHATKLQIIEIAKETILNQQNSIREYEQMVKVLLAERGL